MESVKRKIKQKEYTILAGQMPVIDGKVKPDPSKGELRFFVRDNMLTLEWKNLDTINTSEPLVIFENEWEWNKIQTSKGRVYALQSKSFPEEKHFFWLQYPNIAEDGANETIINNILNTGQLVINESNESEDITNIESVIKKEEITVQSNQNNQNTQNTGNNNLNNQTQQKNQDFIKNFSASLKNLEKSNFNNFKLFSEISITIKNN